MVTGHNVRAIFAHATSLCKEVWKPVITNVHVDCSTFDFRGHGSRSGEDISGIWDNFGVEDVLTAVARIRAHPISKSPDVELLIGVGHSFGGAALLKAELAHPGLFSALVLCEPILLEDDVGVTTDDQTRSSLAERALKRKSVWPDRETARKLLHSKPMFSGRFMCLLLFFANGLS
jgi:pimeloyl-ACP methyl ester carboxylesterase